MQIPTLSPYLTLASSRASSATITAPTATANAPATAAPTTKPYDFTNMSRQDIADAGKQLFREGKITLDELFRFDHPDGILRVEGKLPGGLAPTDMLNFVKHTQTAISNMEATGEAWQPKSSYKMMQDLLAKLQALQTGGVNIMA